MENKHKFLTSYVTVLAITTGLLLASCKKGDMGPAGHNGTNGASNVISTDTITVTAWAANGTNWFATLTDSAITQNIVNKGLVSVFIKYGSEWWSLPDINGVTSTQYGFGVGYVSLFTTNSNGTSVTNPGTKIFRIVAISASNRLANPTVNWKKYNEIKKVLDLKD